MKPIFVDAIGLVSPGLPSWQEGRKVLQGEAAFIPESLPRYNPLLLPPNERRRATDLVRLAFQTCEDALNKNEVATNQLASLFATSAGDYQIVDQICRALTSSDRAVSPTQFHNSVHNSAAGYWSIATSSKAPSTSLSCFDFTFSAGLIEAVTFAIVEERAILLVVYDARPPSPLLEKRPIAISFGIALLLSPQQTTCSVAMLSLNLKMGQYKESLALNGDLEAIRLYNPAARSIPLLELLALKKSDMLVLQTASSQFLTLDVSPC